MQLPVDRMIVVKRSTLDCVFQIQALEITSNILVVKDGRANEKSKFCMIDFCVQLINPDPWLLGCLVSCAYL